MIKFESSDEEDLWTMAAVGALAGGRSDEGADRGPVEAADKIVEAYRERSAHKKPTPEV